MKDWEQALHTFLKPYLKKDEVAGALLCGSYATGNQSPFSDIDVHIITNDTQKWRERGNRYINGFLIEYFINPPCQLKREFKEDLKTNSLCTAVMFGFGKILYDKTGQVKQLQKQALTYYQKSFAPMTKTACLLALYHIWDLRDEFQSLSRSGYSTDLVYADCITDLVNFYCQYHRLSQIPTSKLEKIFAHPQFAKRYHVPKLPPRRMMDLTLACLRCEKKDRETNLQKLYDYVVQSAGGFDINRFKLRSKL